jgi:hypothetical protein
MEKSRTRRTSNGVLRRLKAIFGAVFFVHNLSKAVPWLVGFVASATLGAYAWIESRSFLFTVAAGILVSATVVLSISFAVWFLGLRRRTWRQRAEEAEGANAREIHAREAAEARADEEAARRKRSDLANDLVKGMSLWPLQISDATEADKETGEWIAETMQPAMDELMPGVGLGIVGWRDGLYTLLCGVKIPKHFAAILPKRSNRHLGDCLRELGIAEEVRRVNLSQDMLSAAGLEWLVCVRNGSNLDEPAETVFAAGARIIADARRGIGGGANLLPV